MSNFDDYTKQNPDDPRDPITPEKFAESAIKFATDTAYAAAGLADLVAKKAKELYEQQRAALAEKTPEGVDPNFKQFVDAMPDQFKQLMDDAEKRLHDLTERGRHVVENLQAQTAARPRGDDRVGPFDTESDAAEATFDADVEHDPVTDPVDEGGPVPPAGSEGVGDEPRQW